MQVKRVHSWQGSATKYKQWQKASTSYVMVHDVDRHHLNKIPFSALSLFTNKKEIAFFCSRKMQSSRSWLNKIYSWIYWSTVDLFMQSWWVPCGQLLTLRELLQKNEAIQFSTWLCRKGHPQPHSCQTFCFSEVSPNAFETQWKQLYEDSSISFPQNTWFSSSFVYF